jgi:LacI family transcriptional regulator
VQPTIRDIAKKVNRSITTVSRALHDYDDVSPETKELVRAAAKEMGYVANKQAQLLRQQHTDTIGFILPTFGPRFSDPFFSEFLAGIGNAAAEHDYDLLVSTCPPGEHEMDTYEKFVQSQRVDGFIIVRTRVNDERILYLDSIGFPFVAFGRVPGLEHIPYIDENSEHGMRLIVDHLVKLGHRKFACIAPSLNMTFANHRIKGLKEGLTSHGIQMSPNCVLTGDLTEKGGYERTLELLSRPERPTAIVACNDLMAIGAIRAIQDFGLTVGREISVTGFDDIPISEYVQPSLTTVSQPIYQIGRSACDMLIDLLNGKEMDKRQILLEPALMVRNSTGIPLV